ncbi:pentapeptide repeat protein [Sphaerospermopsis kisseleviana NIES-73]|nr:pentapeptide repeat protein [Sphaerospermopsis kisseleviana NIES-73]
MKDAGQLETEVGKFLMKEGINIYIAAAKTLNQLNPNFQAGTLNQDKFWCEGGVTISRIHRAKGNEANMVYVVGIDKIAENENDPNLRNQLFVALTRSRGWACMSGIGDYPFYSEINQVIKSGDTFTFTYKKPPKVNTGEETE